MEFLRIGENQLKITLSEDELLFYGLDLASLSYSSTETRRGFWALLDDAKHATGFDAAASKVSVQIYASKAGGCEMYISAEEQTVSADTEEFSDPPDPLPVESGLTVCKSAPRHFSSAMGAFSRLCDLLSACLALYRRGYNGESSAWQANDRYYLHLGGNTTRKSAKNAPDATDLLWEFALPAKEVTLPYLAEHGTPLCAADAVEKLSKIAT